MSRIGVGHLCLTPWTPRPAAKSHVKDPFSSTEKGGVSSLKRGEAGYTKIDQSNSGRFRRGVPIDTGMPLTHNMQLGFTPCSSLASMLPTRASACSSALVAKEKSETLLLYLPQKLKGATYTHCGEGRGRVSLNLQEVVEGTFGLDVRKKLLLYGW